MMLYVLEPGMNLKQSNGKLLVKDLKDNVQEYPMATIDSIVLSTKCQITSQCLESMQKMSVPVSWLAYDGRLIGSFHNPNGINIWREKNQFKMSEDPDFCLELSKRIVKQKTIAQAELLCNHRKGDNGDVRNIIKKMGMYSKKIDLVNTKEKLGGVEGYLAKLYFEGIRQILPSDFRFEKRTKRPPKDPVSSLLGFLYHLLFHEVYMHVFHSGCNVHIGMMHELRQGHPALVSDLMEEWRPTIADDVMLQLIRERVIFSEDFECRENQAVYLRSEMRKVVIRHFEIKMNSVYSTQSKNGVRNDYRAAIRSRVYDFIRAMEEGNPLLY